jgi:hypothetical protein
VINPQRDIINDRKRSKSPGQAAQINGRQSTSSPNPCRGRPSYLSLDQYARIKRRRKG